MKPKNTRRPHPLWLARHLLQFTPASPRRRPWPLLLLLGLAACATPAPQPYKLITYASGFQLLTDQTLLPVPAGAKIQPLPAIPQGMHPSPTLPGYVR